MPIRDLEAMVRGARRQLGRPPEPIGSLQGDGSARFELFHAANSICSQKVRVVLAQHDMPYLSNAMHIGAGETYLPEYVRLRMAACDLAGLPLVSAHSGSTAVGTGGCDPAVVPTLVDWQTGQVIIDSKRICIYLDQAAPGAARLRPDGLAQAVDEELDVVDGLPNYQMLVGNAPGTGRQASSPNAGTGVAFAMSKVERCDRYLAECVHDADLQRAYRAKRAKELDAAERLFAPASMQAAYGRAEAACERLERRLATSLAAWLFGDRPSMADLFWGIELLRMQNLGADAFWRGGARPRVAEFVRRCEAEAAIRSAVLDWPGALY
ncbi:2,5-dichlorohydroquinone reductive dechlorinase [Pigmentiphaga humi]|uniref:2,5-dichlorohydroquinone reductive dechlorinase n=1 Tax=Pigmentiphaga humi TaxID=2478468 RepID=A0A3P4B5S9_9BURK|nr:glutathione S-transferase family protein [Pigmentiphaga humi]VCU71664.1 2,5-dichlorohydroquinone reductive dechlorinase [Pigmentiphaga humi]